MKRIVSFLMVFLIVFSVFSTGYAETPVVISDTAVWWIIYQLLASMGIGAATSKTYTFDQLRKSFAQDVGNLKDFLTELKDFAVSHGTAVNLFSPVYWIGKIISYKTSADGEAIPSKVDVTLQDIEDLRGLYEDVYGLEGEATQSGKTPQVNIQVPQGEPQLQRGYMLNEAFLVSAAYEYLASNFSYNKQTNSATDSYRGVNCAIKRYFISCPCYINDVLYDNAVLMIYSCWSLAGVYSPLGGTQRDFCHQLVIRNSPAYNQLVSTDFPFSVSGYDGFLAASTVTDSGNHVYWKYFADRIPLVQMYTSVSDYPIFNMIVSGSERITIPNLNSTGLYDTVSNHYSFISGVRLATESHDIAPVVNITVPVTVDTRRLESTITGWQNAVTEGQIAQTEAISVTLAETAEEYERLLAYGITSVVDVTQAGAQSVVDSITHAAAVAASLANVGELDMADLTLSSQIITRFPFCVPFDLYNAFAGLQGLGASAPQWTLSWTVRGATATVDIDLSMFDKWAKIIRWGILVLFNIGLILITRKMIKG